MPEVRDRIVADLKQEKGTELARQKAATSKSASRPAKSLNPPPKPSASTPKPAIFFARNGSISGAASGKQLSAAFQMKPGDVGAPLNLGVNWLVYRVAEKQEPNPADFDKQKKDLTDQVLQSKRSASLSRAFQTSLEARLKQEGKLKIMPDKLKTLRRSW